MRHRNGPGGSKRGTDQEGGLRRRIAELANSDGAAPFSLLPGPHLIGGLVTGAKRWLAEQELKSILDALHTMPESAPIDGKLIDRIADLREALNEFLDSPHRLRFEIEELRGFENLRDHIALQLGQERRKGVWSKKDLPAIWVDFLESK